MDERPQKVRRRTRELQVAARAMRQPMAPAEERLWAALRNRRLDGLKFRRQHGVGTSVFDFYCPIAKLVIEVDGEIHNEDEIATHDAFRTEHVAAFGYRVIRFRNAEVMNDLSSVLSRISEAVNARARVLQ